MSKDVKLCLAKRNFIFKMYISHFIILKKNIYVAVEIYLMLTHFDNVMEIALKKGKKRAKNNCFKFFYLSHFRLGMKLSFI